MQPIEGTDQPTPVPTVTLRVKTQITGLQVKSAQTCTAPVALPSLNPLCDGMCLGVDPTQLQHAHACRSCCSACSSSDG